MQNCPFGTRGWCSNDGHILSRVVEMFVRRSHFGTKWQCPFGRTNFSKWAFPYFNLSQYFGNVWICIYVDKGIYFTVFSMSTLAKSKLNTIAITIQKRKFMRTIQRTCSCQSKSVAPRGINMLSNSGCLEVTISESDWNFRQFVFHYT